MSSPLPVTTFAVLPTCRHACLRINFRVIEVYDARDTHPKSYLHSCLNDISFITLHSLRGSSCRLGLALMMLRNGVLLDTNPRGITHQQKNFYQLCLLVTTCNYLTSDVGQPTGTLHEFPVHMAYDSRGSHFVWGGGSDLYCEPFVNWGILELRFFREQEHVL
jgi:hypothetical protein